jgi:hypothetical protein
LLTTFTHKMTTPETEDTIARLEARLARLEAALFGRPPVEVPVNRGPTPFDARVAATELELADMDAEMAEARAAWFAVRDRLDASRAKKQGSFESFDPASPPTWVAPRALKDAMSEAQEAVTEVERRWTRVKAKLTALQLAADRWRGENI